MKYLKIQQDLLKAVEARETKGKSFIYPYFETNDKIFICPEGHFFVAIPKFRFYLDKKMVFKEQSPVNGEKVINADGLQTAIDTHTTQSINVYSEKMKLHKFTIGDEAVFVNEVRLKYFDLKNSTFKGTNRKSPIYIYEDEELVGIVLAVNHKEV